jgi:tRNA dimethylallyltransferase
VYKGLDIGTGKITKREMRSVPHHLLDVASPKRIFSADDFVQRGHAAIQDIRARGKLPIVVGGTGFYIDALVGRIVLPNVPPNLKLRSRLEEKSVEELFAMLKKIDPQRALTIEPEHKRRIIRAIEIAKALGKSPPMARPGLAIYDTFWIGINPPFATLEKKISTRLVARIKKGMIAEGKRLHATGLSYKRMNELGLEYRALSSLLQGKTTRMEMIDGLKRAIRKYAKRQIVYWKRNKEIRWFEEPHMTLISRAVQKWLSK